MRITGPTQSSGVSARAPARGERPGGGAFAVSAPAAEPPAPAAGSGIARPVAPLDAVLALQAYGEDGRPASVRRGRKMLDALDELKIALLEGRVPEGALDRLLAVIGERINSGDRELQSILDDIELRARVELAKLGHEA